MAEKMAFIDAYGDPSLGIKKVGASTHFIITAVIVDSSCLDECKAKVEFIRKKHFQKGEIKSEKVGTNLRRRLKILNELCSLEYNFYSLIVDKSLLKKESGLAYKKSFYKFISGKLFTKLYNVYPDLKVVYDEMGSIPFMIRFKEYVYEHNDLDLFGKSTFEFVNSKADILVQASDFIAGSLARCYDANKLIIGSGEILSIIKRKSLGIEKWPSQYRGYTYKNFNDFSHYDEQIANLSAHLALKYIKKYDHSTDEKIIRRVNCLKYLLLSLEVNPDDYIMGDEIIKNLSIARGEEISDQSFHSEIIGSLRDEGILIATSSKGYKLPASEKDCYDYINLISSISLPMIKRLSMFSKQINLATQKDLLSKTEYKVIKKILELENENYLDVHKISGIKS
jgi:hypothetical protein